MNIYVIIAAGGIGTRIRANAPKQLLQLANKPIIIHTLQKFANALPKANLLIAAPENYITEINELLTTYKISATVVAGGSTRFHSVKNALDTIQTDGFVLVHDAARCLITEKLIQQCVATAVEKGNAVPCVLCTDSVRLQTDAGNESFDRNKIQLVQTPQVFKISVLQKAFAQAYQQTFTDEANVMELYGEAIHIVEGENTNIKITNPIDLQIAEIYIKNNL